MVHSISDSVGSRSAERSGEQAAVIHQPRLGAEAGAGDDRGLVPSSERPPRTQQPVSSLASMPVTLHVRVPLAGFRLQTLASLQPGSIVATIWPGSEDLPVSAGSVRIAWAEFAVTDLKRSVRVTRIS
jgi:flagellar motor switch/type III secretory pathway protein FliN